jgi:Ferritin-like domain
MLVASGALVVLEGCGSQAGTGEKAVKHAAAPVAHTDVQILLAALALERRTVAAYVASVPLMPHGYIKASKAFLSEELQHVGELISLVKASGGTAPPRADHYDVGQAPRSRDELFAGLHSLERLQIASYLKWIPRLSPGPVRAAVATILACDAQHVAILRAARGEPALAGPLVTGEE